MVLCSEQSFNPSLSWPHVVSLWAPIMAFSFWFLLWTEMRALKRRLQLLSEVKNRKRVGYKRILSCPFWLFFVLILVQIPSVWLCNCRLSVSRGLPWEVGMIHSLLSLSFLSCFWCWFCVWFCYAWLYMLLVIMPIEGVIPKAKEIEEELNWRSVVVWKKTATIFFYFYFYFFPPAMYLRTFQLKTKILNPV